MAFSLCILSTRAYEALKHLADEPLVVLPLSFTLALVTRAPVGLPGGDMKL